ncbi:hypothetical protein JYB62_13335 [Algoriphagus lutimaris]|uniref:DUF6090 family protein n=1 Tax=Algoriphagus lutimaris TaxID=613197 RepID=UPI00196A9EF2|nr:DUF6090 family protein [Algoriphagus lutimaris]MBN3520986.1 hypothetical protein [Algoriphagus lutimaris]
MKRIFSALKDKWPEYILEILVITIGILGAFALNNWNENRLEEKEEDEILKSVKKDLENTISEFEFLNVIRESILYGTRGILNFSNATELPKNELDSLLGLTFSVPTFNNKMGTIELLFTSGKVNLIKNETIKARLIAWPGYIEDMTEEEIFAVNLFHGLYYQTLTKYVVIDDLVTEVEVVSFFGGEAAPESFPRPPLESDYSGLLKDKTFLNHLRMRALNIERTNAETRDLIEQAKEIIQMIDLELEK